MKALGQCLAVIARAVWVLLGHVLRCGVVHAEKIPTVWRRVRERWNAGPVARKSLRLRLGIFFAFFLVLAWLVAALFAWKEAREYIDEFFDTQQLLFAKRLATTTDFGAYSGALPRNRELFPGVSRDLLGELEDDALAFAVFTGEGQTVMTDNRNGRRMAFDPGQRGFSDTRLAGKGDVWRILWLDSADGRHVIAVGQEVEYRQAMALDMLGEQIAPWIFLLPVLLIGLLALLSRELRPLRDMAQTLRTRSPDETTLLDTDRIPSEVLPMAESLNDFISRINATLVRERSFISDAAHELRTPLAGLRVQAQVASQEDLDPEDREEALRFLRQGIDRCTRLLEQLLALSRLEAHLSTAQAAAPEAASRNAIVWASLLDEALQEYRVKAEEKGLALHCEVVSLNAQAQGYPALVSMLLRNLLDNAVNYTPCGGSIAIRLENQRLCMENDAPPRTRDYADRLGERFFRPPGQEQTGSGLGLSIVRRIADIHGFTMTMRVEEAADGQARFHMDIAWPL